MNPIVTALDRCFQVKSPFTGLSSQQEIPEAARSNLRKDVCSMFNPGISHAVFLSLTGGVQVAQGQPNAAEYFATAMLDTSMFTLCQPNSLTRQWGSRINRVQLPIYAYPLMALVESLTTEFFPETRRPLKTLTRLISNAGLRYPVSKYSLSDATLSDVVKQALYHLTDTLDAELRSEVERGFLEWQEEPPSHAQISLIATRPVSLAELIHPAGQRPRAITPEERLTSLTQRGGAALLVGPPGTFKTETAKRVAVQQQMRLVIAKGAPGVEDRDFLGGIYPTGAGHQWIDGPLSRAFLSAQQGPTLFLIDEVLRYLPEHLNVIIGGMDTISRAEGLALGLPEDQLSGDERLYLIGLPNGDHLTCPARNLTWVLTTNLGEDHLQSADRLDAALLSRIDLIIDFDFPDEARARALYEQGGGDPALAELVYQIELLTREAASSEGGLLLRSMEARKSLMLIRETRSLMDTGLERVAALLSACQGVLLPYCCARDAAGRLEEAAREMLIRRIEEEVLGL